MDEVNRGVPHHLCVPLRSVTVPRSERNCHLLASLGSRLRNGIPIVQATGSQRHSRLPLCQNQGSCWCCYCCCCACCWYYCYCCCCYRCCCCCCCCCCYQKCCWYVDFGWSDC